MPNSQYVPISETLRCCATHSLRGKGSQTQGLRVHFERCVQTTLWKAQLKKVAREMRRRLRHFLAKLTWPGPWQVFALNCAPAKRSFNLGIEVMCDLWRQFSQQFEEENEKNEQNYNLYKGSTASQWGQWCWENGREESLNHDVRQQMEWVSVVRGDRHCLMPFVEFISWITSSVNSSKLSAVQLVYKLSRNLK